MITFRGFLPLASPLMVRDRLDLGPQYVLLAFAIDADGALLGMVVPPDGGPVGWFPIDRVIFPAPVQLRNVAGGKATLQ